MPGGIEHGRVLFEGRQRLAVHGDRYVLEREQFLSAVTGQVRSAQAAEAVVDARLRASREAPPV